MPSSGATSSCSSSLSDTYPLASGRAAGEASIVLLTKECTALWRYSAAPRAAFSAFLRARTAAKPPGSPMPGITATGAAFVSGADHDGASAGFAAGFGFGATGGCRGLTGGASGTGSR